VLEAHRLISPCILADEQFQGQLGFSEEAYAGAALEAAV
jgi:hypothetical protein